MTQQTIDEIKLQIDILRNKVNQLEEEEKEKKIIPWEPKGGDFFFSSGGILVGFSDEKCQTYGIERTSKEQAQKARNKVRQFQRLLAYHDEYCPDYEFIENGTNGIVFYDIEIKIWKVDFYTTWAFISVYFPKNIAEDLVKKLNSGEVVL
jgi:hypothetical protein